ncbi:MAG: DUF711 family protein [Candidatus Moranbacteria bacterium]|nr:DUF711 family protein [Candidatus Moranbacteria bacterium]
MKYSIEEILETIEMIKSDKLDIRTVTLGINLMPASDNDYKKTIQNIEKLLLASAKDLVKKAKDIEEQYGIPIVNKRITITPISLVLNSSFTGHKKKDRAIALETAKIIDKTAKKLKVDFIGGFGCLVEKSIKYSDQIIIESLSEVLNQTERVCAFVNIGSTKAGINMRAVARMGGIIHKISLGKNGVFGCAKLVVFCNAVSDNPFMAGGFHGIDQGDKVINIGISGPGVVRRSIKNLPKDLALDEISKKIKNTAFKITRAGEVVGREIAQAIGVKFGSIDLSLAPTADEGDSVGEILELMGLEKTGTHGTTAALALLTDAVKKGGLMASSSIGGLSGAFIPVCEDAFLAKAVKEKALNIDKLEAMTSICSVGLDMIAVPGDTRSTTLAAIIADEAAIGMVNHKTTAARLIPVKGKKEGQNLKLGGLFGQAPIIKLHKQKSDQFIWRKGQIPPTITSFRN